MIVFESKVNAYKCNLICWLWPNYVPKCLFEDISLKCTWKM